MNSTDKKFLDELTACLRNFPERDVVLDESVWNVFCAPVANSSVENPPSVPEVPLAPEPSVLPVTPKVDAPVIQQTAMPVGTCTDSWDALISHIQACTMCKLALDRVHSVIERGSRSAKVMFIGEAPSRFDENNQRPFSDDPGALLDKMIAAMQLTEADYYITQVVKCRPTMNRTPTMDEGEKCTYYLMRQIELVNPRAIVLLGRTAATHAIRDHAIPRDFSALIGKWFNVKSIPAMLICSPAYIHSIKDPARQNEEKRRTWIALQEVMRCINE